MAEDIERVYVIPLNPNPNVPTTKKAAKAIKQIRAYVAKHMKAEQEDVMIDHMVNEKVWARGRTKISNNLRVKVIQLEGDDMISVELPQE